MNHGANRADAPNRESLADRVEGIAAWINDLDERVRATELATGDEKTAKELRKAIEALAKHDPKLEKRLVERVDVLADRVATLASTVSTTAAALARKDGEIAALRKCVDDGGQRVEALVRDLDQSAADDELEKLRTAVRAIQAERQTRAGDSRVEGLNAKLIHLTERVDLLATTIATTAAGLAGREGEIAALRRLLEESSARIERTGAELRRLKGDEGLAHRLDALQTAIDATSASLAGGESDVAALRARIDEAYSRVGTVVAGIQGSIATLSSQVAELGTLPASNAALEARSAELDERADELAARLASLTETIDAATGGLAEGRAELVVLRERADEASARLDGVVGDLDRALARLPEPGTVAPEVEERLMEISGSVAAVTSQLVALAATSSALTEDAAQRADALGATLSDVGGRLDALERARDEAADRLEETSASFAEERERLRAELQSLAQALADASNKSDALGPELQAVTVRLDTLDGAQASVTAEVERVSARLAEVTASSERAGTAEELVGKLGTRIGGLEQNGAAVAAEVERLAQALDVERATLRSEVAALSVALSESGAEHALADEAERRLAEIAARLERVEATGTGVTSEVARVAAALEAERQAVHGQLAELSAALTVSASTGAAADDDATAALMARLASRVDTLEAHGAAIASEVAREASARASELEALEAKLAYGGTAGDRAAGLGSSEKALAELGERVAAMERERESADAEGAQDAGSWQSERADFEQRLAELAAKVSETSSDAPVAGASVSDGDLAQLRVAVEGLRMRLASSEQELAAVVGTRDVTARLDELSRRLESLERAPVVIATGEGGLLQGDGRFRLELRALELRMEHAEAAARENREAVLVQLERLAARIEWRFKRLEDEYESRQPGAVAAGQVVPLRPEV